MEASAEQLGAQVDRLESELDMEYYLNFSGQKDDFNTTAIYERYSHLFADRALLGQLLEALGELAGEEFEKTRRLFRFSATTYLDYHTREMADRVTTLEANGTVTFRGTQVPFRQTAVLLANEASAALRRELEDARMSFVRGLNPESEALLHREHALSEGLGYESYAAMFEGLKGFSFRALATELSAFLGATERLFLEMLGEYSEALLDMPREGLARCDLPRLFRADAFDAEFPPQKATTVLRGTLRGLGVDLDAQKNIVLDDQPRPRKSPRAFCAPVRIPDEVYLVISPQGGVDDYRALLHEAGHAEHHARTRAELSPVYKRLGDAATSECYAFLLDNLAMSPGWLHDVVGLAPARAEEVSRFAHFNKLYMLRRYSAKFLYEVELHRGAERVDELYSRLLTGAAGVPWPAEYYLSDTDDGFYCADYLRAWTAEVQVRQTLAEAYGEDWYRSPRAGEALQVVWSQGNRPEVEDLLHLMGHPGLDPGPMVEELRAALEG